MKPARVLLELREAIANRIMHTHNGLAWRLDEATLRDRVQPNWWYDRQSRTSVYMVEVRASAAGELIERLEAFSLAALGTRDWGRAFQAPPVHDPRETALLAVLGLQPGATTEQARVAYRLRVRETHPDVGGDEQELRRVLAAGEELGVR